MPLKTGVFDQKHYNSCGHSSLHYSYHQSQCPGVRTQLLSQYRFLWYVSFIFSRTELVHPFLGTALIFGTNMCATFISFSPQIDHLHVLSVVKIALNVQAPTQICSYCSEWQDALPLATRSGVLGERVTRVLSRPDSATFGRLPMTSTRDPTSSEYRNKYAGKHMHIASALSIHWDIYFCFVTLRIVHSCHVRLFNVYYDTIR